MPEPTITHIFLDTNTALHFKRPDQVDWRELTGANEVLLVAAPVFLRELENQKVHNSSRKLQERAGSYMKWLHPFVRSPETEVREGVRLIFLSNEPQIDFSAFGLSHSISDDHLIASVIEYAPDPEVSLCVATADMGLEVKLYARDIHVLTLPGDLRLPSETDPMDQEIRKLKKEISQYQDRIPKMSVTFGDGENNFSISMSKLVDLKLPSLAEIKGEHRYVVKPGEEPNVDNRLGENDSPFPSELLLFGLTSARIDKYNQNLSEYFDKYGRYLNDIEEWQVQSGLHTDVVLLLSNSGTAPATNIDLMLDFPNTVAPVETGALPKKPKPPNPPSKPHALMDIRGLGESGSISAFLGDRTYTNLYKNDDGVPVINADKQSVRISLPNLKHQFTQTCEPFFIRFVDRNNLSPFCIQYHLSADEVPCAVTGELHFRIDEGQS